MGQQSSKEHGIWCDAVINDEGCSGFDVSLAGQTIVRSGQWEFQARLQAWREILTVTKETMTQTLFIGDPGKDLKLASTIQGTKR